MPCFLGNADEGKARPPPSRQPGRLPLGYVVSLWMWGTYTVPHDPPRSGEAAIEPVRASGGPRACAR